jgi:hypothetical protein
MGWGRTLFLGNIGNRLDIEDCENDILRLKQNLRQTLGVKHNIDRSQDRDIAELQKENNELKLYLAAVIRLLVAKNVITAEEITKLVQAVDVEDGTADGRMDGPVGGRA